VSASGHGSRLQLLGNFKVECFSALFVERICPVNLCLLESYSRWVNPKSMKLEILMLFCGVNQLRCCCSLGTSYFLSASDRFSDRGEEGVFDRQPNAVWLTESIRCVSRLVSKQRAAISIDIITNKNSKIFPTNYLARKVDVLFHFPSRSQCTWDRTYDKSR